MAVPFPQATVAAFLAAHAFVLVLEEPDRVVELQCGPDPRVLGRATGHVPRVGELTPDVVATAVAEALQRAGAAPAPAWDPPDAPPAAPPRRPTLCPGCGHRAAFWAIRDTFPTGLFPSDIGCYTLGVNLRAVDTVLDMGASLTVATGLSQALRRAGDARPVVATIGDSTFFHAGVPGLLDACVSGARFVVVVLDNGTVAMTGRQPTPGSGRGADGGPAPAASLEALVAACGARLCGVVDPFDTAALRAALRAAEAHTRTPDGGVAVVIARRPCVLDAAPPERIPVAVTEACVACNVCTALFECPALLRDATTGLVTVDAETCIACGSCVPSCPHGAIVPQTAVATAGASL
jgi:indolepyruvate ferredoxin oxidoreductase alpha subunit